MLPFVLIENLGKLCHTLKPIQVTWWEMRNQYWTFLILGFRFLFNIIILNTAAKRLPEFSGYKGRRFPGQMPPPPPIIQPRRMELPPNLVDDWKNIGSKRNEFQDLGLPRFNKEHRISVTSRSERKGKRLSYFQSSSDDYDIVSVTDWTCRLRIWWIVIIVIMPLWAYVLMYIICHIFHLSDIKVLCMFSLCLSFTIICSNYK